MTQHSVHSPCPLRFVRADRVQIIIFFFLRSIQIDYNDSIVRKRILSNAIKRASKWMSLQEHAKPMVGQVGGVSDRKKPVLTLAPDYVLKPVNTDHRGVREIAFYEAIKILQTEKNMQQTYASFLSVASPDHRRSKNAFGEWLDTLAMAVAISVNDEFVLDAEKRLRKLRKALKKEAEILRQLVKFSPKYYGVLGQQEVWSDSEYGLTDSTYLLLQDLTINFSKPCVMDLKMGCQSYEPDADEGKKQLEISKYPQQAEFGFRIVGMRMYDPTHAEADEKGFRYFGKAFGRSLHTRDKVVGAFRTFLNAGIENGGDANGGGGNGNQSSLMNSRKRTISNLLVQLRQLRRWFDENKSVKFYASSLLIVFEGDRTREMECIKMIDFGRVRREAGGDLSYQYGLNQIKSILTEIMEEQDIHAGALPAPALNGS
jgi:1D-myo-inositol-tetrakisphosphate 5-kinase/inositol-polyphosphate multikinase